MPSDPLTAAEFEREYVADTAWTVEHLRAIGHVVRPCTCGEHMCRGWQSIRWWNLPEFDHLEPDAYVLLRAQPRPAHIPILPEADHAG